MPVEIGGKGRDHAGRQSNVRPDVRLRPTQPMSESLRRPPHESGAMAPPEAEECLEGRAEKKKERKIRWRGEREETGGGLSCRL